MCVLSVRFDFYSSGDVQAVKEDGGDRGWVPVSLSLVFDYLSRIDVVFNSRGSLAKCPTHRQHPAQPHLCL